MSRTRTLIAILLLVLGAACAPAQAPAPTAAGTGAIDAVDSAGRAVKLAAAPQRIISLAPSTTEIAFALGLDKQLVALDEFSDYPEAARNLPKVTKGFQANFEQIVTLKPDLVLAAGITAPDAVKKLEELKITVAVIGAAKTTIEGVLGEIQLAGRVTGRESQAKQLTAGMQERIDALKATMAKATTRPRVFWELDASDPSKPFAPGPGSFVDEIITFAGGANTTANAKTPYAQVSAEEVVRANPQIIILSDALYGTTVDSVLTRPGWEAIDAVKTRQVFGIDDNLVSRPGPRIVDGLQATARLIHPELFK